jgi:ABC-type spermidine/putrescine transport system permease subunit II
VVLSILLAPSVAYMFVIFVVPILVLFLYSFWMTKNYEIIPVFTLKNYAKVFSTRQNIIMILRSVYIGLMVSILTIVISFPVAYALTFNKRLKRFKDYFLFMILISMFSSYLIRVYAWRTILGDFGIINMLLIALGLIKEPLGFLLYTKFSVILALIHILTPFTMLPIFSSLQNINPDLLKASHDLGAGNFRTLFKTVVPNCRGGLSAAFIFSFILSAGDYVIPALLGGTRGLMIGKIIADKFGMLFDWNVGSAITFVLILIIFAVFFAMFILSRMLKAVEKIRITPGNRRPEDKDFEVKQYRFIQLRHRINKFPYLEFYTVLFLIFMFLPPLIIIIFSFNKARVPSLPFTGFSLKWYREIIKDPNFVSAFRNSITVAFITAFFASVLGTSSAFAYSRFDFRLKKGVYFLLVFPITIPGLLLGISLLSFFTVIKMQLSLFTVVLGHLVFTIPFVFLNVNSSLENFDITIQDAARDLGANSIQIFTKILLPLIKSSIIGDSLIAFALSFDEFIVTFFIIGGGQNTIPMLIFSMLRRGIRPSINAVSSLVLVSSFILITVANKFSKVKVSI